MIAGNVGLYNPTGEFEKHFTHVETKVTVVVGT